MHLGTIMYYISVFYLFVTTMVWQTRSFERGYNNVLTNASKAHLTMDARLAVTRIFSRMISSGIRIAMNTYAFVTSFYSIKRTMSTVIVRNVMNLGIETVELE